jgi:hypothetical protein
MMDKRDALNLCICKNCPSFVNCKEKMAYCVMGKSKCIKSKKGCLCPTCKFQQKNEFNGVFYCVEGAKK